MVQQKAVVYKGIPEGLPVEGKHLVLETKEFDLEQSPPPGGATLKIRYVSFDPYLRGKMRSTEIKSYTPAFEVDETVMNMGVASIIKSDHPDFKPGDLVSGYPIDFAEYQVVTKEHLGASLNKVENPHNLDPKLFLVHLGMPGLCAYSSLYEIGKPKKGETILVSAASGAIGQIVCQIAKHEGLRVIGSVGDDKKLAFLRDELGVEAFNYNNEKPADALKRLLPEGLDIYYENVGGEILDAAINAMNTHGRIIACGMISQYNDGPETRYGVKNLVQFSMKQILMQGFLVSDPSMGPKYSTEVTEKMTEWILDGSFKPKMDVTYGMENAISGLLGIFQGRNFGKALLEVAPTK